MAEVSFQGKTFEVDEDGFLLRFDDWCPEWMEYVKESEGISEITPDHQKILNSYTMSTFLINSWFIGEHHAW